jgi:hypothetical protein
LSPRAAVQEEKHRFARDVESTFSVAPWVSFQRRLQDWDFASLGFSLLPFFLCLTFLGSNLAGRTYGPSHWFATY